MANVTLENRDTDGQSTQPHGIETSNLPDPEALPELRIYSRSTIFYWWPIWLSGYIAALITYLGGEKVALSNGTEIFVHPNTGLGLTFVVILALVMMLTNVKLRGIYSVVFILAAAFMTVLLGWLGWWDRIFAFIPQLTVFMNFGFYFILSTLLLGIWLARLLVFDKLVFWRVRPGQLTAEHVIGGGEQSFDTRGMLFEQRSDDFFRHKILGLGSADLLLMTTGARKEEIDIPNVLFADRKIKAMQRLIAIKPDEALAHTIKH
ncbi:hypothetical protein Rvan_2716 [Rhodomicrobium vannielii ATCC 17100]|uniref:Uncharacterized protein n=1 Tax=Rhodomicrobium vannielii (strain ATCC 17100 / DSM 162 / LMG 4299 / NCIMB 10020 / ATH 3.1.1) TaxID=648757 RepID=E3I801_RHOVT|nr:hypothetical protein [Rhodomicrobium vannielii]ADP71927.1 hypothetical protein Rvan_2716 [Rhodomicrobium vannielii ATCC 17100]